MQDWVLVWVTLEPFYLRLIAYLLQEKLLRRQVQALVLSSHLNALIQVSKALDSPILLLYDCLVFKVGLCSHILIAMAPFVDLSSLFFKLGEVQRSRRLHPVLSSPLIGMDFPTEGSYFSDL